MFDEEYRDKHDDCQRAYEMLKREKAEAEGKLEEIKAIVAPIVLNCSSSGEINDALWKLAELLEV